MNQSTPMRRRVFLVGLTMPILVPILRARAQGFVPPTPPGGAPFGLNWGMSFESIRKLFPIPPEDPPLPIPEGSPLEYLRYQPLERTSSEVGAAYVLFRGHMLPRVPYDTDEVVLWLGYRDALFEVKAHGRTTTSADAATNRYKELSSLLSELYGPGKETLSARSWFRKPDLIPRSGTNAVQVTISLRCGYIGSDIDAAYWSIDYQNRAGVAQFQADHLKHQKEAL